MPLTGTGLSQTLTGITDIDAATATSSCGGTVTARNNTLIWAGGTVAAAPANGFSSCTVSVQARVSNTPGSFTTTIPAGSITNDQGKSNRFQSAASFNSVPLTRLYFNFSPDGSLDQAAWSSLVSGLSPWYLQNLPGQTPSLTITNTNETSVTLRRSTLGAPNDLQQPRVTSPACRAPQPLTPTFQDVAYTTYMLPELTVPPGSSCVITFDFRPSPARYTATYQDENADRVWSQVKSAQLTIGSADEDSSFNGTDIRTGQSPASAPTLSFLKTLNGSKSLTVPGGASSSVTLALKAFNLASTPEAFSLQDALPPFADLTGATVTASKTRNIQGECTTSGITLDQATKTLNYNAVVVPPGNACTYAVTFRVPAGSAGGTWVSRTNNNAISTDATPATSDTGLATQATLYVQTAGEVSKDAIPTPRTNARNIAWYRLNFSNPSATDMTGVRFTDTWSTPLLVDPATSYSTCGGTITPADDGKGITFSDGGVPALGSCQVVIGILPDSNRQRPGVVYTNALPAITTTSGHLIVPKNDSAYYGITWTNRVSANSSNPAPTGSVADLRLNYTNASDFALPDKTFIVTLPPQLAFVPQPLPFRCSSMNNADAGVTPGTISPDAVSVNGQELRFTFPVPIPAARRDRTLPIDQQQNTISPVICSVNLHVTSTQAGTFAGSFSTLEPETPETPVLNTEFSQQFVADPTYTINKSFSPQQVYAGVRQGSDTVGEVRR
ncbi:hypothetical protein [Deinococcus sp. S9]|uniref:DUF7933 domain-containing protein n=1 Tax=Deinococcus sp. S9 TaxID=2545754 RepID=UPI00105651E0|nr:hypothetical protein [Deinococcus sp. S9]TDE84600.1 hypothetical protein E0686_16360 [Deinococcus sp. S9]